VFSLERLLDRVRGLPRPPRYWVAYSGGLDSTVLLHALVLLRDHLQAPLSAIHLDHGLHADSTEWAAHCRRQCDILGVHLVDCRLDISRQRGVSLEAQARTARLEAFRRILGEDELLLTAQHRDDQAETLLLQLLRGSGLSGLAAMPTLSSLGNGYMARPLLGFSRKDLRVFARDRRLRWIEDPSNAETGFDRNYLRHRVLPIIAERWPAYAETLSRSARHCAEAQGLIDHLAHDDLEAVHGRASGTLSVSALRQAQPALCRALLRRWIRQQGFPVPDSRRLDQVLRTVLPARVDADPVVEWSGVQIRRYRDDLYVMTPLPPIPPSETALDWIEGVELVLPPRLGKLRRYESSESAVRALSSSHWQVRFGVPGARCALASSELRKSLKKHFQEVGVPPWLRPFLPMVYVEGELAWVGGIGSCRRLGAQGMIQPVWLEADLPALGSLLCNPPG